MYEKELQELGLSEKESRVYLASLELGADTVQNISKKAGINRPTAYVQIELLKNKGLMSQIEKGSKTFYMAESPERLEGLLNIFEKELGFKKTEMARILPGLKGIFAGAGERPRVRFFEGAEGAKAMQSDFLKTEGRKIEAIANLDKLLEFFPKHEDEYGRRRIEKKIESFLIYTRKNGPLAGMSDPAKLRMAKFAEHEKLPISADITIFGDKVAIATYKTKPIGVIIESSEVAETLRGMFYLIWATL